MLDNPKRIFEMQGENMNILPMIIAVIAIFLGAFVVMARDGEYMDSFDKNWQKIPLLKRIWMVIKNSIYNRENAEKKS